MVNAVKIKQEECIGEFEDKFEFKFDYTKETLKAFVTNLTTKFQYKMELSKKQIKDKDMRKTMKGLVKLLINGISKKDKRLTVELRFINLSKESIDDLEYDFKESKGDVFEFDEDFELTNNCKLVGETGDNMVIQSTFESEYDDAEIFVFVFNPVVVDEFQRLTLMSEDGIKESLILVEKIENLEKLLKKRTSLATFYQRELDNLKVLLGSKECDGDRKLLRKIKTKIVKLQKDFYFLKPNVQRKMQALSEKLLSDMKNSKKVSVVEEWDSKQKTNNLVISETNTRLVNTTTSQFGTCLMKDEVQPGWSLTLKLVANSASCYLGIGVTKKPAISFTHKTDFVYNYMKPWLYCSYNSHSCRYYNGPSNHLEFRGAPIWRTGDKIQLEVDDNWMMTYKHNGRLVPQSKLKINRNDSDKIYPVVCIYGKTDIKIVSE